MRAPIVLLGVAVAVSSAAAAPLSAQGHAIVVFADAGRTTPARNLNDTGDDFAPAFSYRAGVALQLGAATAVRATLETERTRYRGSTATLTPRGARRLSWGGDLQIGWPGTSAFVPYVFVGAGAVVTNPDDSTVSTTTNLAGRAGVGVNRVSGIGAWFLELGGTAYRYDGLGFRRIQVDLRADFGFAFALGF